MSSTTPTMRHGSLSASRSSETVARTQTTSPARLQAALVAPVHRDLAARPAARSAPRRWRRSSGWVSAVGGQRRQLALAVAGQLAEARIGLDDAAGEVGVDDADRHVVEDVAEALLALAQRALGDAGARRPRRAASAVRSRTALSMRRVRPVVISSERAEHRRRQQADGGERARRCGRARRARRAGCGADAQVPLPAGEGERPLVDAGRRLGLAAGAAGDRRRRGARRSASTRHSSGRPAPCPTSAASCASMRQRDEDDAAQRRRRRVGRGATSPS